MNSDTEKEFLLFLHSLHLSSLFDTLFLFFFYPYGRERRGPLVQYLAWEFSKRKRRESRVGSKSEIEFLGGT